MNHVAAPAFKLKVGSRRGAQFGNQGIATRLLSELMASALVDEDTIVYAWPTRIEAAAQVVNLFRRISLPSYL